MNKKILAAAIGAAMVAPLAAQADMKLSGRVAGELVSADGNINMMDFGNSRLQFDINDDSGFYARYAIDIRMGRLQSEISANDGKMRTNRDQYVGIKGGFGAIQAGRVAGAVKNIEGDPFIGTFLEYRNAFVKGGAWGSSSFINNMIEYNNKFGDMGLKVQYDGMDGSADKGSYGASVKAKLAGANIFLGANKRESTAEGYYKLGGNMKFGDFKVGLIYENDEANPGDEASYVLGVGFNMGGGLIDVSYTDKGADRTAAGYRVGWYKKQSKKAHWWLGYTQNGSLAAGQAGDTASFGGGVRVDI
jgi:hypothetical protein